VSPSPAFPPTDIRAFLSFCAGEWMALRSTFLPDDAAAALEAGALEAGEGDEWHSSERGELTIHYQEPSGVEELGDLLISGPGASPGRRIRFAASGDFEAGGDRGRWQLWPDGSLELLLSRDGVAVSERIWFTKPNLRLRSTIERHADGRPLRASFSSEIRRVSRPAPNTAPAG